MPGSCFPTGGGLLGAVSYSTSRLWGKGKDTSSRNSPYLQPAPTPPLFVTHISHVHIPTHTGPSRIYLPTQVWAPFILHSPPHTTHKNCYLCEGTPYP